MIRFVFKWMFRLFLLAVALTVIAVVVAILSLDSVVRQMMEHNIRAQTGMDAELGRVSVGLLEPRLEIRDLKLFNPPSYGGTPFLDIPEIHVEYDRAALTHSQLHLILLRFNLGELDIVKNEAGQTNLFALGLGVPLPQPGKSASLEAAGKDATAQFHRQTGLTFVAIDNLNISIGTLKFIDLKNASHNRTQKIGIENLVLHNVKSPADLVGLTTLIALRSGDFFSSLLVPADPGKGSSLLKLMF